MKRQYYEHYRALQNHGVDVTKERIGLRFNAGGESETPKHVMAKSLTAYVASREYGYMTDSEVDTPNGEIDTLLWGLPDRLTLAVEAETSPTEGTIDSKKERYVDRINPIDDIVVLNLNEMPMDRVEIMDWVGDQL